jgi:hypothetical protein
MTQASLDPGPFNIGEAASRSGVTSKMVRHYESLGLLPKVGRTYSGYRQYTDKECTRCASSVAAAASASACRRSPSC